MARNCQGLPHRRARRLQDLQALPTRVGQHYFRGPTPLRTPICSSRPTPVSSAGHISYGVLVMTYQLWHISILVMTQVRQFRVQAILVMAY